MKAGVAFTVDAEEVDRLELSLLLFDGLLSAPALAGWDGLGLAVQSYQKRGLRRAPLARRTRGRIRTRTVNVRLVKGAYWDAEIKRAQERGLPGYPSSRASRARDVSFLACARFLLQGTSRLYPQFASHNAHTVAWVMQVARENGRRFEFQRLHGMGEELYDGLLDGSGQAGPLPRVCPGRGRHEDLLPYLVRRLLENGANTSFVQPHRGRNGCRRRRSCHDPVAEVEGVRLDSASTHPAARSDVWCRARQFGGHQPRGRPRAGPPRGGLWQELVRRCPLRRSSRASRGAAVRARVTNPANRSEVVGEVEEAGAELVDEAARQRRPGAARLGQAARCRTRGDPGARRRRL